MPLSVPIESKHVLPGKCRLYLLGTNYFRQSSPRTRLFPYTDIVKLVHGYYKVNYPRVPSIGTE